MAALTTVAIPRYERNCRAIARMPGRGRLKLREFCRQVTLFGEQKTNIDQHFDQAEQEPARRRGGKADNNGNPRSIEEIAYICVNPKECQPGSDKLLEFRHVGGRLSREFGSFAGDHSGDEIDGNSDQSERSRPRQPHRKFQPVEGVGQSVENRP